MRFLHAMVRVRDLGASLAFFRDALGLVETRRRDYPQGRFTLLYLAAPASPGAEVELTYNYDDEDYGSARNFGHLAFEVDDIYCRVRAAAGARRGHQPTAPRRPHGVRALA